MTADLPLGDLVDLQVGFAFKSRDFSSDESFPRLLRGDNIVHGATRWENAKHWAGSPPPATYDLAPGDVVLAMDRPWIEAGLKYATIAEGDLPALLVQRVARLRARENAYQRYLRYVVADPRFTRYVRSVQTGSAVPHISGGQILAFRLERRGRQEQFAIAEVLGALDDKIGSNSRLVDVADRLAEAMVGDALDGGTETLASAAAITMGSSPPGTSYNEFKAGVQFYQGVRDFGVRYPRQRVWTTEPARFAAELDTLLSVRAPVGRTNIAISEVCLGRGLAGLRSVDQRPWTLFHRLRIAKSAWLPFEAEGTVFGAINRDQLRAVRLPTVESDRAESLETLLGAIERLILAALRENAVLSSTRDELLPLLMSGRVTVRDAEKAAEEVL